MPAESKESFLDKDPANLGPNQGSPQPPAYIFWPVWQRASGTFSESAMPGLR